MNTPRIWVATLVFLTGMTASAQWVTQDFDLQEGWNAIYLRVQPEPADCASIVARGGLGIAQVMTYNDSFSSVQFIQDISEADPDELNASWLRWGTSDTVTSDIPMLYAMSAGRAYLVHAAASGTWSIQGRPVMKPVQWRADSYNLVGFAVHEATPPTFASFFAECPDVDLSEIYRLSDAGHWTHAPSGQAMRTGEAFWIRTVNTMPTFQGPVSVSAGSRHGLDYGETVTELPLRILVEAASDAEIYIKPILSEVNPGSAGHPAHAGPAPLMWWNPDAPNSSVGKWETLSSEVSIVVPGGDTTVLRFAVLRREFPGFTAPSGVAPAYTRLLHISDGSTLSVYVPVRALGTTTPAALEDVPIAATGLWVGEVVIDRVSQPYPVGNPGTHPVAEGGEYSFRILLHCSSNGTVRLLSHAALIWQDGTYGEPDINGYREVLEPGTYTIVANDALVPALVEGDRRLHRRLSTTAFSHKVPLESEDSTPNSFRFVVHTPYNDPRSPFVHPYHPMHDNRTPEGGHSDKAYSTNSVTITNRLGEVWSRTHIDTHTTESMSITRSIDMAFAPVGSEDYASWGTDRLGGEWQEVITGLHSLPVQAKGTFLIQHINPRELDL